MHTAERPFNLLLPAIGRIDKSVRLRMKSVESQKASSLLMAGAALRRTTLCPGESSLVARWLAENCRLPCSSRHSARPYWRIRPPDVAKYKDPRLEMISCCKVTKRILAIKGPGLSTGIVVHVAHLNSSSSIFSPWLSSVTLDKTSSK